MRVALIDKDTTKTTATIRKEIGQLIKQANAIRMDTGDSFLMRGNEEYFLRDFHENKRGGLSVNFNYYHRGKKDIITVYNQLAQYINSDTESKTYFDYMTRKEKEIREKFKNTMKTRYGTELTDSDIQEYIEIKDTYPELFENFEFYEQLLDVIGNVHSRKESGKTVMQTIADIRRELMLEKEVVTDADVRRAFLDKYGVEYQ